MASASCRSSSVSGSAAAAASPSAAASVRGLTVDPAERSAHSAALTGPRGLGRRMRAVMPSDPWSATSPPGDLGRTVVRPGSGVALEGRRHPGLLLQDLAHPRLDGVQLTDDLPGRVDAGRDRLAAGLDAGDL